MFRKEFKKKGRKILALLLICSILIPTEIAVETKNVSAKINDEGFPKQMMWSSSFEDNCYYQKNMISGKGAERVSGQMLENISENVMKDIVDYSGSAAYYQHENMGNLFDGSASTKFLTTVNNPEVIVKFKNNSREIIHTYYVTSANDAEERDPKNWVLQGRNSDDEEWSEIDSRTNEKFDARYQKRYFKISGNNKAYSQYRLQVTSNKGNGEMTQFAEFGLLKEEMKNIQGMITETTDGPESAWNQKTGKGWTGDHSLVCRGKHEGNGKAYSSNIIFEGLGIKVQSNTYLRYVIFPDLIKGEKYDYEYTSMHMAIDLKFTDGTYLSDLDAEDQYSNKLSGQGQADGRTLLTKQWNEIYSYIGQVANGKTIDQVLVVYDMNSHKDGDFAEFRSYFDDIEIYNQNTPKYSHLSDYVNILRGTNGTGDFSTGLTAPAVTVPNGFNLWTPSNQNGSDTIYQYQQTDKFRYMQVSHEPSIWVGDRGTWQFMVNTSQNSNTNADYGLGTLKAKFSHDNEVAKAHYYKIDFDGNGGDAANSTMELTPTSHAAIVRFTYKDNAENRSVIFDCNRGGQIEAYDGRTFRAYSDHKSNGSKRMYVYGEFNQNPVGTKKDGTKSIATFSQNQVVMKVATSYISYEQAKKNLELEIGNDNFDTVFSKAQKTWDEQLGIVSDVKGASYEQLVTLYSCIYRMYMYPNLMSENTGSNDNPVWKYKSPYRADDAEPVDGKIYINNGFWDTYRTAWSAYQLFTPSKATEYLNGLVQHYKDQGWVPRWIAPGGTNSMVGTSSDIIFGDALAKGIDFDYENAYQSALKNASVVSDNLTNGGRNRLNQSNFLGYVPGGGENFSWSIEGYINDYGIAQMAKKLAEKEGDNVKKQNYLSEYQYFLNRSKNYSLMFNNGGGNIENKWLRGKNEDGGFTTGNWYNDQFDPFWFGSDYTETNAFNMSVSVPQDGVGLANLYGGREQLADKIDTIFTTNGGFRGYNAVDGVGGIHEQKECREIKLGQYGHSNQPSHHIPYMYLYSSRPWETTKYVRDILNRCYMGATFGQGYIGDEDNGEMSAWYVQSAIGFYPLSLGTDEYAIGAPLFDEVTINLENNKKLVIKANNNSKENVYVDSMYVNGQKYDKSFIKYSTLENGGLVEFNMSSEPNKSRGSSTEELARSTTGDNTPQVYKDLSDDADKNGTEGIETLNNLYDNNSDTKTKINNNSSLMFTFSKVKAVRMLTLTSADSGRTPDRVQVYGDQGDNNWQLLGDFRDSGDLHFKVWGRYTRPFMLDRDKVRNYKRYHVVLTGSDAYLSEIELLGYKSDNVFKSDLKNAIDKGKGAKNRGGNAETIKELGKVLSYAQKIYDEQTSSDDEIKDAYQRIVHLIDLSSGEIRYRNAARIEAESFDAKSDAIVNDGNNIGGVKQNTWVRYDNVSFADNTNTVEVNYSAQNSDAGGYIEIFLDSKDGTPVGTITVPKTGEGWGNYKVVKALLNQNVSGTHSVYAVFKNDGSHTYVSNVDWFSFANSENQNVEPTQVEIEEGTYVFKPATNYGFAMMPGNSRPKWTNNVLFDVNGSDSQKWEFVKNGDHYNVKNVGTGINLHYGESVKGAQVDQNGSEEQYDDEVYYRWKLKKVNSGAYAGGYLLEAYLKDSDGKPVYATIDRNARESEIHLHNFDENDMSSQVWYINKVKDVSDSNITKEKANEIGKAFLKKFYVETRQSDGSTRKSLGGGFWVGAELNEMLLDGYETLGDSVYKDAFDSSYQDELDNIGNRYTFWTGMTEENWQDNPFNDDVMWLVLASIRAHKLFGSNGEGYRNYLKYAKDNFNMVIQRGMKSDDNIQWCHEPERGDGTTSCIDGPTTVAGCYLGEITGKEEYFNIAKRVHAAQKKILYVNEGNDIGKVEDSPGNSWPSCYNQGTWIGGSVLLYKHYHDQQYLDDAINAMNYLIKKDGHFSDEYGVLKNENSITGDDLPAFRSILMRYIRMFVDELNGEVNMDPYIKWIERNARVAYNNRNADGLIYTPFNRATPNNLPFEVDGVSKDEGGINAAGMSGGVALLLNLPYAVTASLKDAFSRVEAENCEHIQGAIVENTADQDGDKQIAGVRDGYYTGYEKVEFGNDGANRAEFRVSTTTDNGRIEIHLDQPNGKLIGTAQLPNTGGWNNYQTVTCDILKTTGNQKVYLVYKGNDWIVNLNWFQFYKEKTETETTEVQIDKNSLEINGFQINTKNEGLRVLASVEPVIEGKKVVEFGNIYGIVRDGYRDEDMVEDTDNLWVRKFAATNKGVQKHSFSGSDTAIGYIMTMIKNGTSTVAYQQEYKVRSYAKLEDGRYVYSDIYSYSIFRVAQKIYDNKLANNINAHNYLFNNILKRVNPEYQEVEFDGIQSLVH